MSTAWIPLHRVEEIGGISAEAFSNGLAKSYRPVVIRGLVTDWPLVAAAHAGGEAVGRYLRRFESGAPAKVLRADAATGGRFFYDDAMRGYNFAVEQTPLTGLVDELLALAGDPNAPALYAGSTSTADALPGFAEDNPMPLATPDATPRIWIGNRTHVPAHYDVSDNIAVVAMGRRRFTLFPPDQTPNLYVGPLDVTIAGQPVSMVDLRAPDLARYPRFAEAMEHALVAELEPGDAIFIPTLWWHSVAASGDVNVLVNYWYNHPPDGSPFAAMLHAMMAIRDLPPGERAAWRGWFEAYVFDDDAGTRADHLPPHARGVTGPPSDTRRDAIRGFLLRTLTPPRR